MSRSAATPLTATLTCATRRSDPQKHLRRRWSHAASEALCDGSGGSYGKLSAVGSSGDLTLDHALDAPATALPVVINTSAVCPSAALSRAMDEAIAETAQQYQLAMTTYMTECFDVAGPDQL